MEPTIFDAALGLSRAIYSASASSSANAARSHLTRIPGPLLHYLLHVALGGKIAAIRFFDRLLDLFNLPIIECYVLANGFCRQERSAALRCGRELVQLLLQ